MAKAHPIPVTELHELFESHFRLEFAERHHRQFALIFRDATAPGANRLKRLRSGALFFETMEAAVDEAVRRDLQPGYFLVAGCVVRSEQQPAILHSGVGDAAE